MSGLSDSWTEAFIGSTDVVTGELIWAFFVADCLNGVFLVVCSCPHIMCY